MNSSSNSLSSRPDVLRLVGYYALFAGLWILLSDKAVHWLVPNGELRIWVEIAKGWLFVAVTSVLLYGLLRRFPGEGGASPAPSSRAERASFALFAVLLAVLAAAGISYDLRKGRQDGLAQLRAITALKARQLGDWLKERERDAVQLHARRKLGDRLLDRAAAGEVEELLLQMKRIQDYAAVHLYDPEGRPQPLAGETVGALEPTVQEAVARAARHGVPERVGPYLDRTGALQFDVVVPLDARAAPFPVVVFRAGPGGWLAREMQTWPVPSASGEVLLVRREGTWIRYLAGMRAGGGITDLRQSSEPELLAAQVLRGDFAPGLAVAGRDFRGHEAFGLAFPVAGTGWILLGKIDRSELLAGSYVKAAWIGITCLLALAVAASAWKLLRQRGRLAVAAAVQASQSEQLRTMELLSAIADASEDAIFAKDLQGRYQLFNRAACAMVGRSAEEVLGRNVHSLFPADQAEMLLDSGARAAAGGRTFTQEEELDTLRGRRTFLATKGPLRDAEGQIFGTYGISRDITGMKQAELALRESEERYRALFDSASVGIFVHNPATGRILQANQTGLAMAGCVTLQEFERVGFGPSPYSHEDAIAWIRRAQNEGPQRFEWLGRRPGGEEVWEEIRLQTIVLDGAERVLAIAQDITARKAAEAELLQRAAELERFNRASVGRELDMIELKRRINDLSTELGSSAPFPLGFLDPPSTGART